MNMKNTSELIEKLSNLVREVRHTKWPSGLCVDGCGGCRIEISIEQILDDIKDSVNPAPDQLFTMFEMQAMLNKRCGVDTSNMSEADKTKWVLNYVRATTQELAELTDSVPWKWWAKYQKFDEQNARVEVVDLFHFVISLAQVLGMSSEDVFKAYMAKNKVNHQRQDSGYAIKDAEDCKSI